MTTSPGALFTPGMLLIGSFSPTKVLLSHSSTSSTPIPSPDHNRYDPLHKGVTFRLGGVKREMSLLELRWRVGLYSERESRDVATVSGLRREETVNLTHLLYEGECYFPVTRGVVEEDKGDDEEGDGELEALRISTRT
ncbi:hypothetical protein Tco_0619536 [Tanacetum coccineum]